MQKTSPAEIKRHLQRNFIILLVGVLLAIFLVKLGVVDAILAQSKEFEFLAIFIAGMFFTSVLTVGVAVATLAALVADIGLWPVVIVGAIGSVVGDFILFSFVKDRISDDFMALINGGDDKGWRHIMKMAFWHRLLPILGFLLVASPLPDEIGLAMMGISKLSVKSFIWLSFIANFVGILIVGLVVLSA
ncbi:MAG: hypothetical protein Q8Q37_02755 [bacterium]|nr:hypothetical protein [bacterium]